MTQERPILEIDGQSLTIADVLNVARGSNGVYPIVRLKAEKRRYLAEIRSALEAILPYEVAYGINTGCGSRKDEIIEKEKLLDYQKKYIQAHAVGVGDDLPIETVRAMMLLRVNSLAVGPSAVTPELCEFILELLNRNIIPAIPALGSVGASGDLIPLAHLGAVMIGRRWAEVFYEGQKLPVRKVFQELGIERYVLQPKEAMGLTNGATLMLAQAILAYHEGMKLLQIANVAVALNLEAVRGEKNAFDARIHAARRQTGQILVAQQMRELFDGSILMTPEAQAVSINSRKVFKKYRRVQDAYSLRCVPQVHGAIWDALEYLRDKIEKELNAATDNPLVFQEGSKFTVLSGGNFHGEPLAIPLDTVGIAMAKLAAISNARQTRILSRRMNYGLPQDLSGRGQSNDTGFMITQYMVASQVNALVWAASPASPINIPTSDGQEDYVSMGSTSAWKLLFFLERLEYVLANEILLACQGISLVQRALKKKGYPHLAILGKGTQLVYNLVREKIPVVNCDTDLKPLLDEAIELVKTRAILQVL